MVTTKILRLCCCCLLLFFSCISAYAQININGRVVNENGDAPIEGASVYFNNTTIFTTTNQQGYFKLDSTNLLNTEMVVTCTGYDLMVFKPTAAQIAGKRIVIKIRAKDSVQTSPQIYDGIRQRWLAVFYENFLGLTEEASKCVVVNEKDIHFSQPEDKDILVATADTPIVVVNKMLGYKISFDLVEFAYNAQSGQSYLYGYSRYEELGDSKKYTKARQQCYYGSTMHFYRSLISHQLLQQGFNTFLLPPPDTAKYNFHIDVMAFTDEEKRNARPVSAAQILYIDSANNFSIRISGKLLVQYTKDPSSKKYLAQNPVVQGMLKRGVESYINFKVPFIGLNNAGVLSDATSATYNGYWEQERTANILPFTYVPD